MAQAEHAAQPERPITVAEGVEAAHERRSDTHWSQNAPCLSGFDSCLALQGRTGARVFSRLASRGFSSTGPEYHILQYEFVPNVKEKRAPYRPRHLEIAQKEVNDALGLFGLA